MINRLSFYYISAKLQMRHSLVRPMFRFTLIMSPIFTTLLLYEMYLNADNPEKLKYAFIGGGLVGLWESICFSSISDINRERYMGTIPITFASPLGFNKIILGKILGNSVLSLIPLGESFILAKYILKIEIRIENIILFSLSLVLTFISFTIFSMFFSYIMVLSRKTGFYMNLIGTPIVILSGFLFPIENIPQQFRFLSYILLPTWTNKLLQLSINNNFSNNEFFKIFIIFLIEASLYILLIMILWRYIEESIRKKATLELM